MKERYSCGWLKKIAFREKKIPTTIVTSSISGALATSMALNHCRSQESEGSVRVLQDSFSLTSARTLIARSDNCPACQDLDAQCTIVRAKSAISSLLGEIDTDHVVVEVSDPVLVSTLCKNCDDGELTVIFDRASKYDASIIRCSRCEQDSVEVDIRDSFSIKELQGRFGGRNMPVKFVSLSLRDRRLVIEMEKTCQK